MTRRDAHNRATARANGFMVGDPSSHALDRRVLPGIWLRATSAVPSHDVAVLNVEGRVLMSLTCTYQSGQIACTVHSRSCAPTHHAHVVTIIHLISTIRPRTHIPPPTPGLCLAIALSPAWTLYPALDYQEKSRKGRDWRKHTYPTPNCKEKTKR